MEPLILYHGSEWIVEHPSLALGRPHNDYGPGFYTTPSLELAKEWACQKGRNGYANRYALDASGLRTLDLLDGSHSVLEWIALLLKNRHFDLRAAVSAATRDWLVERYCPSLTGYDLVIGYRADDSYFSYARAFVENTIPMGQLDEALRLGRLGEQTVLVSEQAFERLRYGGSDPAAASTYYPKFAARDAKAREDWRRMTERRSLDLSDLYAIDLLRGEVTLDDPRIQQHLSARR